MRLTACCDPRDRVLTIVFISAKAFDFVIEFVDENDELGARSATPSPNGVSGDRS